MYSCLIYSDIPTARHRVKTLSEIHAALILFLCPVSLEHTRLCVTIGDTSGKPVMEITADVLFGLNLEATSLYLKTSWKHWPFTWTWAGIPGVTTGHQRAGNFTLRSHECHHHSELFPMKSHGVWFLIPRPLAPSHSSAPSFLVTLTLATLMLCPTNTTKSSLGKEIWDLGLICPHFWLLHKWASFKKKINENSFPWWLAYYVVVWSLLGKWDSKMLNIALSICLTDECCWAQGNLPRRDEQDWNISFS